jgi:hypothetical protein
MSGLICSGVCCVIIPHETFYFSQQIKLITLFFSQSRGGCCLLSTTAQSIAKLGRGFLTIPFEMFLHWFDVFKKNVYDSNIQWRIFVVFKGFIYGSLMLLEHQFMP